MTRSILYSFLICFIALLTIRTAYALKLLHEEELYDTSGQASIKAYYGTGSPKESIQFDKNHTVHYFHQNVVIWESPGEITLSLKSTYYGDDGNYVALISPEPIKFIAEYDKYPYYPNGLGVSVGDVFYTGPDGLPLPKYREFDPNAPTSLPPNTAYVRMKGAPVTVTMINNRRDIVFVGEGKKGEPDWEAAKDNGNTLISIEQTYKQRIETGYIYIWAHD